jgi:hypothetical protein
LARDATGSELETVEDFNQAIAFFEKTYEERQTMRVMIKELQHNAHNKPTICND